MIHTGTFRGHEYRYQEGKVHPAYSLECFTADESDFREKYWTVEKDDAVVDVGASYGAYSFTAAAVGARVIAIEPEPTVFVDLVENNKLNGNPCQLLCCGLWNEFGVVDMRSYAAHWPAGTITGPFIVAPLDALGLDELDWLKLDVEGAEVQVLAGALRTIRKFKPTIIVESHVFLDSKLTEKCRELLGVDYDFEVIPREPCEMLIARPR